MHRRQTLLLFGNLQVAKALYMHIPTSAVDDSCLLKDEALPEILHCQELGLLARCLLRTSVLLAGPPTKCKYSMDAQKTDHARALFRDRYLEGFTPSTVSSRVDWLIV